MLRALLVLAWLLPAMINPVAAQETSRPQSPILIMDSNRVIQSTNLGRLISAEIETAFDELATENRKIEAELEEEELSLTEQRSSLPPDEFRALADAFDEKVQRIRAEQDSKQQVLEQRRNSEQQDFFTRITPVLSAIGNAYGAVVILERRNVILAADGIDITDQVIAEINALADQEQSGSANVEEGDATSE